VSSISCIICAYNEAERIGAILDACDRHPALGEVIAVDDGSTDGTAEAIAAYSQVRAISCGSNRGKTYAMAQGIAAAQGDYLMFLDADLAGLTAQDIDRLAAPIRSGAAEATLSLRSNSLGVYRLIGLDFVTGERVVPARLLRGQVAALEQLPRWGAETFINRLVIDAGLPVQVVDWRGVCNVRKYRKIGRTRGMLAELGMIVDALTVMSPLGLLRQNLALLQLAKGPAARRRLPHLTARRKAAA